MAEEAWNGDLLVVGGGIGGLTAASVAARNGASVLVLERAPTLGGSASMSSGYLWTLDDVAGLEAVDPGGNRALQSVILDEYDEVIAHVVSCGGPVADRQPVLEGHGRQIDVPTYIARAAQIVESSGGQVIRGAQVEKLTTEGEAVCGAVVSDSSGSFAVTARATLLATGGFAQSQQLLAECMGAAGGRLRARSAPFCTGDGLRLAESVGGARVAVPGFYGHLVGWGVDLSDAEHWDELTLLHSRAAMLVNRNGVRFTTESRGDNINAERTLTESDGVGMLLWDEQVQQDVVLVPYPAGNTAVDRFAVAVAKGAPGQICDTPEELATFAAANGFAIPALSGDERWPMRALLVEPAITFPYSGIRVDVHARVLDSAGKVVPGLYAAGSDLGGVYADGYAGGLALAATFGLRAVRSAGLVGERA